MTHPDRIQIENHQAPTATAPKSPAAISLLSKGRVQTRSDLTRVTLP